MRTTIAAAALTLAATFMTACGQNQATLTPAGPSPLAAAGGTAGAMALGTARLGRSALAAPTLTGNITAVTGSCPAVSLTVGAQTIAVDATTTITGGACTDLLVGRTVTIVIVTQPDGSLTASAITLATDTDDPIERSDVDGTVASVQGACPVVTFLVHGERIVSDEATAFVGGSCAMLRPGSRVRVEGTRAANGTLVASLIRFESADDDGDADDGPDDGDGDDPVADVSMSGHVSALRGACPSLTFNLRGFDVATTSRTTVKGGTCGDLRAGVEVEVVGSRVGTRGVLALDLRIVGTPDDEPAPTPDVEVEVSGAARGVTGSCPALAFTIGGTEVRTTAATGFRRGSCSAIRDGVRLEVKGTRAGDGTVTATRVSIERSR